MIQTDITILINRKSDLDLIKQIIIRSQFQFPVYILEFENNFNLRFTSKYEEWELDSEILKCFPSYEFSTELENNKKEIRLQFSRYQSEFCTDGWGRRIEKPLNETKYLVKKSINKSSNFSSKIRVLFKDNEKNYYVNVVNGINKSSGEEGFLLLNEFNRNNNEADIIKDRLYKSAIEAFHSGYYKLQDLVNSDFEKYIEYEKKTIREVQKIPRKVIRDFINSCNKFDVNGIFQNVSETLIFEKRIKWHTQLQVEGIEAFKEYIISEDQELCKKNLMIRSKWKITLPFVIIKVKFKPITENVNNKNYMLHYKEINFKVEGNKIIEIILID